MSPLPPGKSSDQLKAWLSYYDDLNLSGFYRNRTSTQNLSRKRIGKPTVEQIVERSPIADMPQVFAPLVPDVEPSIPTSAAAGLAILRASVLIDSSVRVAGDTLEAIREDMGECTRCRLHLQRNKIVFGAGNPQAQLVFVGEGPGHDEDIQGLPFVGRAGKLLTQMIEAMGLKREDVYICNVVKCRPPENRKPEEDEVATCSPYLYRQIDVIAPKAIVCLGATAAQALLNTKDSISRFRGQWFDFRGAKLLATYHPAYLLRNPSAKGEVWKDLQKVMQLLGLAPRKSPSK